MKEIFLKKDLVTESTLTQDGVLTYIALRTIYNTNNTVDYISVNRLVFTLIGENDCEKALSDALQRGIYELDGKEYISIRKNLSTTKSSEFIVDLSKLHLDTSKDIFVIVYDDEIYKLLTCKELMYKRIKMVKYFVALISTFDNSKRMVVLQDMPNLQGKIGHMKQSYIAAQADNSERTCQRYNEILVDMKMIYVYKSDDYICHENESGNNSLVQISNCYSRYSDREICEQYASNYDNFYGTEHQIVIAKKKKAQANKNRGLAQIYVQICSGNTDYSKEKIIEVYKYISNMNKSIQDDIDEKYQEEYYQRKGVLTYSDKAYVEKLKGKLRDVSIFEQFDFLKEEYFTREAGDNWGEPIDFSIEEMLDMPIECEVQSAPCINESHDNSNHGIFCVTGKDLAPIDIDNMF